MCQCVGDLQALKAMHAQGRGVCDVKEENLRVRLAPDGCSFVDCTVLDLGGSVSYTGKCYCV